MVADPRSSVAAHASYDRVRRRLVIYVVALVAILSLVAVVATAALVSWWNSTLTVVPDGVRVLEFEADQQGGD